MSSLPTISNAIESALIQGDLSKLTSAERVTYYNRLCESLGLNPMTKPFEYLRLNNKEILYAKKDATDQLRKIHSISITITGREKIEDIYIVTARAKDKTGREDESTGAVNVAGLKGDSLANALMKSETKAKRRVTLSVCGLGFLDESEVSDIPEIRQAEKVANEIAAPVVVETPKQQDVIPDVDAYTPDFGKYRGVKLKDVDPYDLANYVDWIEKDANAKGKTIQGRVAEFMNAANALLSRMSPKPKEDESIPF